MINSNGTEIDTEWRKEYEVNVDRCKDETFTLVYHFASTDNSEGEKLEKVIDVPWDPEKCSESNEGETEIILAVASGLVLTSILITIGIICYMKRAKTVSKVNVDTNSNPVYGTYSRGWNEDGDYGDGDVIEMTDNNPVYGN